MKRLLPTVPLLVTLSVVLAMLLYGPIAQPPHYHDFADKRSAFGLPNAADVLSNAGFFLVGLWGLLRLWQARRRPVLATGWPGYCLFLVALMLTAVGSGYYHLAPDDARLVWDRLPIALTGAGLLAAVRAESRPRANNAIAITLLMLAAVLSVLWWHLTAQNGNGELRPYLLMQIMPLLLIPLWQGIYDAARADRIAFGFAILLYVAARAAELCDHQLLALIGWASGHTIKHLLATAAAAVLTGQLVRRVSSAR